MPQAVPESFVNIFRCSVGHARATSRKTRNRTLLHSTPEQMLRTSTSRPGNLCPMHIDLIQSAFVTWAVKSASRGRG